MNKTFQSIKDVGIFPPCDIIVDVAGNDSYAAIIEFLKGVRPKSVTIAPIVVKAPTEYGDDEALIESFDSFKAQLLELYSIDILPTIFIEEPEYWHIMCGRFASAIQEHLNFYTPCIGCHVYFHSIRAYIAKKNNIKYIVSGERYLHDSKTKLNQTLTSITYHSLLLSHFGCTHIQPVVNISSNDQIREIVSPYVEKRISHFECVFDSNYRDFPKNVLTESRIDSLYKLCLKIATSYFPLLSDGLSYEKILLEISNIVETWRENTSN